MAYKKKKVEKLLGEILVENDIITDDQLEQVLQKQAQGGGLIGELVVELGFATEEKITQCVSFQYGFPYLPLENYEIPKEVTSLVPKSVAQHYCLIPVDKIGNTLTVAMANPLNVEAIEHLEHVTSLDVQIFVSTASDIRNLIAKSYNNEDDSSQSTSG